MDEQTQSNETTSADNQAFEDAFSSVMTGEPAPERSEAEEPQTTQEESQDEETKAEETDEESTETEESESKADESKAENQTEDETQPDDKKAEDESEEDDGDSVFAGLTNKEMRNLLRSQSDQITKMQMSTAQMQSDLRKAFGKIGELNGKLKQPEHQPKAVGAKPESNPAEPVKINPADVAGLVPEGYDNWMDALGDFSDEQIADLIGGVINKLQQKGKLQQQETPKAQSEPVQVQETQQQEPDYQQPQTNIQLEQLILDRVRPGWRELVTSSDFSMWVNTQDSQTQQAYMHAVTADDFASVIDKYHQSIAAKQQAASQRAKKQERLERAVTPTGGNKRPNVPTEADDFEAAFNAIIKPLT